MTYASPGVYVEEISTLPPSVAEVSTAVPAFIGYTKKSPAIDTKTQVERISTLLEYETLFGKAQTSGYSISASQDATKKSWTIDSLTRSADHEFLLYYALSLYFKNGGGTCYIVSIGNYNDTPSIDDFDAGLAALEKEDEPTLILLTDAVNLASDDYYALCQAALIQCKKLGDRFAMFDVKDGDVEIFRDNKEGKTGIGNGNLMYGAAYTPYLQASLSYCYEESGVTITIHEGGALEWQHSFEDNSILVKYTDSTEAPPEVKIFNGNDAEDVSFEIIGACLTIHNAGTKNGETIATAWTDWDGEKSRFSVEKIGNGDAVVNETGDTSVPLKKTASSVEPLESIKSTETSLYNQIKTVLSQQRVTLPPSAAVAGIYARVDRNRGVWKAPANESLSSVIGPVRKISAEEQEGLNIDSTAGKSINAIRAFTGKGTLVWGARTLAGNDNEWRYISVRRLFNMIEESCRKSTAFAVFEPNDTTTWLKVKAMIESFLYSLWEQGALAGSTAEAAYFVNIGLGKTMTNQDILEGRMIVKIGVAAVRPAEFIILRFSHKLQEA